MISIRYTVHILRPLRLAAGLLSSGITFVSAQTVQPGPPSARDLALYDKNKNGRLDADELAAMEKDQARLSREAVSNRNASPPDQEDRAVETMSPFVVNSTQDTGYGANSTLAGTRLNTPLSDLGASISVYTKTFLDDISSTDQNFLVYATGMEVGGQFGNISGDTSDINAVEQVSFGARADPSSATRTRGLSAPNFTRGFFTTNVSMDSFEVERVTVARGPNAMLFGVGSPAGVVDSSILQANTTRNKTSITTRFGNNNSGRLVADVSRVLIPQKLGVRIALLDDKDQFNQKPAFEDKKRILGAATWEPFKTTSVRANFESGRTNANRISTLLPFNNISPYWYAAGRPSFDWTFYDDPAKNPNAAAQVASSGTAAFGPGFLNGGVGALGDQVGIFYNDPRGKVANYAFRTTTNNSSATTADFIRNQNFNTLVNRDSAQDTIKMFASLDTSELAATFWTPANLWPNQQPGFVPAGIKRQGFTDYKAFDWNDQQLDDTSYQLESFHTFNVTIDQSAWGNRLGLELTYDAQRDDKRARISFVGIGGDSYIRIDPNVYLPTGQPNPNLGRPFVASGNTRLTNVFTDRSNMAATGYLKYDFKDLSKSWGRWLGHHALSGLAESALLDTISYNPQLRTDGPVAQEIAPAINASARVPAVVVYIGPSIIGNSNALRLQQLDIPKLVAGPTIPITSFVRAADALDPGSFQNFPGSLTTFINAGSESRELIKSQAVNLQSYWLDDYLITLLGWRKDTDYFISRSIAYVANPNNPDDPGQTDFGFKDLKFPHTPPRKDGREIRSYSLVGRLPTKLLRLPPSMTASIFYNHSQNFTPSGSRLDGYGNALPSPAGETKEYGFNLSMFDNKLSFRINAFTTAIQNATFTPAVFGTANVPAVVGFVANWTTEVNLNPQLAAQRSNDIKILMSGLPANYLSLYGFSTQGAAPNITTSNNSNLSGQSDTSDYTARGSEYELTFSPTPNWRIMANVAKQQTIQSNELPWLKKFIATMTPAWTQLANEAAGHFPQGWKPGDPVGVQTVGQFIDLNVTVPFATAIATEGSASPEQRKWRANLVTNYSFGRGSWFEGLKGFSLGGGLRWQDKLGLGYPTTRFTDGSVFIDVKHPYYAKPQTNMDGWVAYTRKIFQGKCSWKCQLTVNNLVGQSDPIGVSVQPTGQVAVARLPPERRWYITNSFDF